MKMLLKCTSWCLAQPGGDSHLGHLALWWKAIVTVLCNLWPWRETARGHLPGFRWPAIQLPGFSWSWWWLLLENAISWQCGRNQISQGYMELIHTGQSPEPQSVQTRNQGSSCTARCSQGLLDSGYSTGNSAKSSGDLNCIWINIGQSHRPQLQKELIFKRRQLFFWFCLVCADILKNLNVRHTLTLMGGRGILKVGWVLDESWAGRTLPSSLTAYCRFPVFRVWWPTTATTAYVY